MLNVTICNQLEDYLKLKATLNYDVIILIIYYTTKITLNTINILIFITQNIK